MKKESSASLVNSSASQPRALYTVSSSSISLYHYYVLLYCTYELTLYEFFKASYHCGFRQHFDGRKINVKDFVRILRSTVASKNRLGLSTHTRPSTSDARCQCALVETTTSVCTNHSVRSLHLSNAWNPVRRRDIRRASSAWVHVNAHFQNGTAARRIRSLTERARTMLIHAKRRWLEAIETSLWPFAFWHAGQVHNHLPSKLPSKEDPRGR